jgi:hypothetical protein
VTEIETLPFPRKLDNPSDKAQRLWQITLFEFRAQKMCPGIDERVEKSVTETLSLIIFVCYRVSVRYGKNVTDFDISECVTESVSVTSMDKSDGGNAPVPV